MAGGVKVRWIHILLSLLAIILIILIAGCHQLSATCYETTSTSSEASPHLHAWCVGEQYTKPYCNAQGECHEHKFKEEAEYTEPAGLGPHTHKLR